MVLASIVDQLELALAELGIAGWFVIGIVLFMTAGRPWVRERRENMFTWFVITTTMFPLFLLTRWVRGFGERRLATQLDHPQMTRWRAELDAVLLRTSAVPPKPGENDGWLAALASRMSDDERIQWIYVDSAQSRWVVTNDQILSTGRLNTGQRGQIRFDNAREAFAMHVNGTHLVRTIDTDGTVFDLVLGFDTSERLADSYVWSQPTVLVVNSKAAEECAALAGAFNTRGQSRQPL